MGSPMRSDNNDGRYRSASLTTVIGGTLFVGSTLWFIRFAQLVMNDTPSHPSSAAYFVSLPMLGLLLVLVVGWLRKRRGLSRRELFEKQADLLLGIGLALLLLAFIYEALTNTIT